MDTYSLAKKMDSNQLEEDSRDCWISTDWRVQIWSINCIEDWEMLHSSIKKQKLAVTEAMAETDFRMVEGGGEALQLDAMTGTIFSLIGK
ncbi:MAG: hypothetical protein Ct9H90mP14_2220 [Methanobacteriota archaeon]|nr:MAG: hypothetical protein Ct9H90mP14_2220 [Euryarchaeota archaeon]